MSRKPRETIETGDALIRVDRLHVSFAGHHVLRDLNLNIRRGETLVIIGESGCGKTVLLKTLIGLIRPSEGNIFLDGKDLAALNEKELTRQRIRFGFLFQQAALFDSLTVAQNIAFPLRQHGNYRAAEIQDIVHARLAQVGLPESVVAKKPEELSGGMRKRVGLARALAMNPEIMLYDEPTTGLDPIMSDVINELIMRTRDQGDITSVIVTHDMRTAQKVGKRVVMLYPLARLEPEEPQILFDGTPQEILNAADPRVSQFVRGEAGARLMEMESSRS